MELQILQSQRLGKTRQTIARHQPNESRARYQNMYCHCATIVFSFDGVIIRVCFSPAIRIGKLLGEVAFLNDEGAIEREWAVM